MTNQTITDQTNSCFIVIALFRVPSSGPNKYLWHIFISYLISDPTMKRIELDLQIYAELFISDGQNIDISSNLCDQSELEY